MPLSQYIKELLKDKTAEIAYLDSKISDISSIDLLALSVYLTQFPNLHMLRLSRNNLGNRGEDIQNLQLWELEALDFLVLAGNRLGNLGKHIEGLQLAKIKKLRMLVLDGNHLGSLGENIKYLKLGELETLQGLNISHNNLGLLGKNIKDLQLDKIKLLQKLNIRVNDLGSLGKNIIDLKFGNPETLQDLTLDYNKLSDLGKYINDLQLSELKVLKSLGLRGNNLGSLGDKIKGLKLEELTALRSLWIEENNLGDLGMNFEDLQLGELKALRTLNIYGNKLGSLGEYIKHLHIGEHKALWTLGLSDNKLGVLGKHVEYMPFGKLKLLQKLWLDDNHLNSLGENIKYFRLGELKSLQELYLGINNLGVLGEQFKLLQLGELNALERLELQENNLGALGEYFPDFVNELSGLHKLTYLNISLNMLNSEQLQLINQMIQQSFALTSVKGIPLDVQDPQTTAIIERNRDLAITDTLYNTRGLIQNIQSFQAKPTNTCTMQDYIQELDVHRHTLKLLLEKLSKYEEKEARIQEIRVGDVLLKCIDVCKNILNNSEMVNNLELMLPDSHPKFEDIRYKRFADETFAALANNENVRKSFIKFLPYYIKTDGSFIQNNLNLQFDGALAILVERENEFDRQEAWQLDDDTRSYYLQFVLLKGLAEQISKQSPTTDYSPRLKLNNKENVTSNNTQMELNDLPEIISLETKDKTHIEKLFNVASKWVNSEACNVSNKDNWIKLMTAVDKLHTAPELQLT